MGYIYTYNRVKSFSKSDLSLSLDSPVRYYKEYGSIGNYALFFASSSNTSDDTIAFDSNLVKTNLESLELTSTRLYGCVACVDNDYLLFNPGVATSTNIYAYDKDLVRTTLTGSTTRLQGAGASVTGYALIGGGDDSIDVFDSNLTQVTGISLSLARSYLGGTTTGNYAIFNHGNYLYGTSGSQNIYYSSNRIDAFSEDLVNTYFTGSSAVYYTTATSIDGYALCGTGYVYNASTRGTSGTLDIIDTSLSRTTATVQLAYFVGATSIDNSIAVFAGGYNYTSNSCYTTVWYFDTTLTRRAGTSLTTARTMLGAASVGKYALFLGGLLSSNDILTNYSDAIDVYQYA